MTGFGVQCVLGERSGVDIKASTRLNDVSYDESEEKGKKSGAGEVQERFDPDPSDRFDVAHCRDTRDDHEEDQRSDDHLDELNESIAQWPKGGPNVRPKMTDEHTCDDGDQDLKKERLVQPLLLLRGRTRLQRRGVWDLHCSELISCEQPHILWGFSNVGLLVPFRKGEFSFHIVEVTFGFLYR